MTPRKRTADTPKPCPDCGLPIHIATMTSNRPVVLDAEMPRPVWCLEHFSDRGLRASYRPIRLAGHTQAVLMEHDHGFALLLEAWGRAPIASRARIVAEVQRIAGGGK